MALIEMYSAGVSVRRVEEISQQGECNSSHLVAIAVNEDGYCEVSGAAEGMKEDNYNWIGFFQWLHSFGLDGVKFIVGDKCLGMLEAVGEVFPEARPCLKKREICSKTTK